MIRSDGRVIEWHSVRALPRKTAGKTKALTTITTRSKPRRPKAKTDKQKLRSQLYNLALDISTLRQQIHDLHERRQLLYTRALYTKYDGDGSTVQRTQAFVELTRPGHGSLDDPYTLAGFLSAVSESVTFGPFVGRDQLVTSWCEFSRRLQTKHLVVDAIRVASFDLDTGSCTVRLDTTTYNVVTMGVLEAFYPAVLKNPTLTATMLGRAFLLPTVSHITFDGANRIAQYEVELDLVGVLTQLTADAIRAGELLAEAAREKRGLPFLALEAEEIKETQPMATVRVEKVWGIIEPEPESHHDVDDREDAGGVDRHAVEFLLS